MSDPLDTMPAAHLRPLVRELLEGFEELFGAYHRAHGGAANLCPGQACSRARRRIEWARERIHQGADSDSRGPAAGEP